MEPEMETGGLEEHTGINGLVHIFSDNFIKPSSTSSINPCF